MTAKKAFELATNANEVEITGIYSTIGGAATAGYFAHEFEAEEFGDNEHARQQTKARLEKEGFTVRRDRGAGRSRDEDWDNYIVSWEIPTGSGASNYLER
jgi:hypothetical protein